MSLRFALFEDRLDGSRAVSGPPRIRAVYVRSGGLEATTPAGTQTIVEDTCALFTSELTLSGQGEVWTFELSRHGGGDLLATEERGRCVLAVTLHRDTGGPLVIRSDRIDFPAGATTPKHGHRGPGIRRLLAGRLLAEIGSEARRLGPGDAWFETGSDPVVGTNLAPASAFIRCMVLPASLKGEPTFLPWSEAEAAKPRAVTPRLFFDEVVAPA